MKIQKLSKGLRIYIRRQKTRIRKEILDKTEQEELISKLYQSFSKKN